MAETAKGQIKVLVIGTQHEFQRHQDTMADREKVRAEFEELLRRVIDERGISLIAEEAGDDRAVWEQLRQEEEALGEFAEAFGGRVGDNPVPTIGKQIADDRPAEITYVDIRAPNADKMTIEQRDDVMAAKTMEVLGIAERVLVIVGEDHRSGVVQRLKDKGLIVDDSFRFPE
jgi:pheromone shutdown protein TraB